MRIFSTILLGLLTTVFVTAAGFLAVDGNLARLTGWYHYRPGLSLFSAENIRLLPEVTWMRIEDLHDRIECERDANGTWWLTYPFRDRMSPEAAEAILQFTEQATVVDTLPLNNTTRENMRQFGVETNPHTITLKVKDVGDSHTTIARYTLGSASPWLADAGDGKNLLPTTYLRTDFYGRDKRIHVVSGNILPVFREGLQALRDRHPLQVDPMALNRIVLEDAEGKKVELSRLSSAFDWVVASPIITAANQDNVAELVASLADITALRVDNPGRISLPRKAAHTISLYQEGRPEPIRISLYEPFLSEKDGQRVCYATVSDRPVVFTLRAAPKVERKGSYEVFIRKVYELPVLSDKALALVQTGMNGDTVYTENIPMSLAELRSKQFTSVDYADVEQIYLRSRYEKKPLIIRFVPGNADSGLAETWVVSSEGQQTREADTEIVKQFIKSLKDVPVTDVLADITPADDLVEVRRRFGLDHPVYMLALAPKSCRFRATLYGHDLPLIKDHPTLGSFLLTRYRDPATGESMWVGMESGGTSIYKLSTKMTKNFSLNINRWRSRNLISFPLSALRHLTLDFQTAPLVLDYDYIGETWAGSLGGEDVTPRINPNRAEHYVRHLQKLRVDQWLSPLDERANAALARPAFRVVLEMEMPDYSGMEAITIDPTAEDWDNLDSIASDSRAAVESLLKEESETDKAMRDMALGEQKVRKVTRTIEIAPMSNHMDQPKFYGRIKETGDIFMLNYVDAQNMAGDVLDR